ncbi:hypothetical protein ROHU_020671 [Labeo rohita]|uniref:Uncharacterized protein n=1 Tax=Labeo rohita TaxID=84645 RepID=A0A498N186_LABRO|nr:hypothetical protein ROHU_020671 [Labeo rohita]
MQPDTCAAGSARHMSSKKGRDQQEYRTGGGYCDPKRNGITRAASLFRPSGSLWVGLQCATPTRLLSPALGPFICHASLTVNPSPR